jgi:hypothetical protein
MADSIAKLKSNGDKAPFSCRPFWIKNVSEKYVFTYTDFTIGFF